jgi:hypothetical protein
VSVVEGVDYIFDRYAFLGIPRDSDRQAVAEAVRKRRSENHPDRLVGAGPEVRERADQVRKLVDDAATVLLNDNARPLFDAALERFEAEDPNLVSADGRALLNLKRGHVNLDYLVRGVVYDVAGLEEKAIRLSGFSERRLKSARRDHQENPNEAEAQDALRDELTTQYAMLTLMEDYAWMRAGVRGRYTQPDPVLDASEYAVAVERHIEDVSDMLIRKAAEARDGAILIGVAKPPLLLAGPSGTLADASPATMDAVAEAARATFSLRSEDIKEIARRKQACLEELVRLVRTTRVAEDGGSGLWDLYLSIEDAGERVAEMAFRVTAERNRVVGDADFDPTPVNRLIERGFPGGVGVVIIDRNIEIRDPLVEVTKVAETLIEAWLSRQSAG